MKKKPTKPAKKPAKLKANWKAPREPKENEAVFLWVRVGGKWKKLGRAKPGSFELLPKEETP